MSAYSAEVLLATSLLCAGGGALPPLQLYRKLLQRCSITEEEFRYIIQKCPRFLLVRGPKWDSGESLEDCTVVARTSLRLCSRYGREECGGSGLEEGGGSGLEEGGGCQQLHLCKFFIYGTCRFGKGRKLCKFSHDVQSDHNYRLLREFTLHALSEDDLFTLLLQNEPALLPEVCVHYNKGSAPHGCCSFRESCTKVHLCQHFVQGDCMFGARCKRLHAISQHGRRMLEERGLSGAVIQELPFIYRNIHHLATATAAAAADECHCVHFHLPYKWEVFDGATWTDLQHMEDIERDFCDPSKTQSCGNQPVDFLTMTQELQPVRRLSTVSSVTRPPHYILTTQWLWYYKGEQGNWVEYGQLDEKQRSTSVTSETVEKAFLSGTTAEVEVVKGHRCYVISFKDMYQRNPKHNTKRRVRRRPRFVSVAEVERLAVQ